MVAAAAVPGNRGSRGVALGLRRGEGRVGNVSELRGKTLGESRREKERGAVGRAFTASPWRLCGGPWRACTGRRRVARSSGLGWPVWANQVPRRWPGRAGGARREAGGPGRPAEQGRRGRAEREKRERKRDGIDSKSIFSQKFLLKHGKP